MAQVEPRSDSAIQTLICVPAGLVSGKGEIERAEEGSAKAGVINAIVVVVIDQSLRTKKENLESIRLKVLFEKKRSLIGSENTQENLTSLDRKGRHNSLVAAGTGHWTGDCSHHLLLT